MGQDLTPEQFAQKLGGTVAPQPSEISLTIRSSDQPPKPEVTGSPDPDKVARKLGGIVGPIDPRISGHDNNPNAIIQSESAWPTFWRSMYALIPDVTGMIGGVLGGLAGVPAAPETGGISVGAGAMAGAGAGGIVGRDIQSGIDYLGNRAPANQNPRNAGEEATRQMIFEGLGRAFGGFVDRFKGPLSSGLTDPAVERLSTNKRYGLGLSTAEITGGSTGKRVQGLAQRGLIGHGIQSRAKQQGDVAAAKAVNGILDTLGVQGTSTGIGGATQDAITTAAARGGRRLEGAVATNLAPRTGMGASGDIAEAGVQAGRTAFARQQKVFHDIIADAPDVDMSSVHQEAWRIFNDEIMPKLAENPALGPKNSSEWQRVLKLYRTASANGGQLEMSPATLKALSDAALEKSNYGPLRVINQVLATPKTMSFPGALQLRSVLREAGKGEDLLAKDAASGLATYFDAGDRLKNFGGIRSVLNDTYPLYEQAASAYATNLKLFESNLVEKIASSNPEAVLSTLVGGEGRYNASRIRDVSRVLQDLPKTYGEAGEIAAGKKAWDTLRAEWFRREVAKDNVFGLSERMKAIDPDVMQAWFPDLAGKNVRAQAEVTGKAFESQLLANLADADPSKVVDMIGATPKNVLEFQQRINALPGPVQKDVIINRVRRAWTEANLASGDLSKLSDRIAKTDPDLLKAWFSTSDQKLALNRLQRIGDALAARRPVTGMGAYEALGAVTVVGNLLRGNVEGALVTAVGFEALPGFVSWSMYNPQIQDYLLVAAAPTATITSKTAALLHAVDAWKASTDGQSAMKKAQGQ